MERKPDLTTKAVLTFQEVLEYTGFSASYLYKLTSLGLIPHNKPRGKMIFFNRLELEKWLLTDHTAGINQRAATHCACR